MANPKEAPSVELEDIFGEDDFVGPPVEATFRTRSQTVQSRLRPRPPAPNTTTTIQDDSNIIKNGEQALSIPYTPLHPAKQRFPAKRGRPPKSATNFLGAPGALPSAAAQQTYGRRQPLPPQARMTRMDQVGSSLVDQPWAPQAQIRFGGQPNFHTSLGNQQSPRDFISMAPQAHQSNQQQQTSSTNPPMTNYSPRIPTILSSSSAAQPAHRTFKPPGERAGIIRHPRAPAPAHVTQPSPSMQQQLLQQQQQQNPIRSYHRANFPSNSYIVPQANPVRTAQEDIISQLTSMSPNLNINDILQRVLSGQPVALPPNGVDQMIFPETKNRTQNFGQQNINIGIPAFNIAMPQPGNLPDLGHLPDLDSMTYNYPPKLPIPEQKKVPTEDDITKQDDDAEANQDEEYHEADTYSDYTPSKLTIGQPHPDPVVETSSLATVEPPDITYALKLPNNVIDNCLLSALQLESVVYASQQHEQFLADGKTRRGFLIGDGAGVGKGRTIAGIIYENFLAGRRKSIWLSVSPDLKLDAERDLRDIGAKQIPVHFMTKYPYGKKIDIPYGVIFSTYTGLVSKSQSVKGPLGTRLGQLITWLGSSFDGVIVFDECHKAKNISISAKKKQSKTADFALEFQEKLPGARVVYASATGASETRHLGYMTRLGLWGRGTPYDEFRDFCTAIERRGVGAMELVAVDLKMRGSYMARQLSFKTTSFDIRIAKLDEKFIELYDGCVELWSRALQTFSAASSFVENSKQNRRIWTSFWAAHQKFFKFLCIGAKVPLVVEIAKKALRDGECVVIGLQSTGEAKTLEALEDGDINEFVSTARATFESLIENHFPAPPRPKTRAEAPKPIPPQIAHDQQDTQGSSTDLSSTTMIDETYHSHEAVKFCAENGLASAELEEDKAARELRKETIKKRKMILEELAEEVQKAPLKDRHLRAKRRAKARDTRQSRIKKPIDDSETEATSSTSTSHSRNPSSDTDDTYSLTDDSTLKESTEDDDDDDGSDDSSPARTKRSRKSPLKAKTLVSDSDSDIEITAIKPRQRRCELIILSSDEDEVDGSEAPNADLLLVHADRLAAMRDELYKMIDEIGPRLPHNTLDDLIDQLGGPDRVAEMTGRKGRVVKDEDGFISYRQRNETDALECMNIAEKERFMKGEKLVAIISEAASSGISLQADRRAGNQLRRVHITIELPWSADRAIQQFGRTHRSNQVTGPRYVFVISELSGEKRFASVVAKRLESLGALTHGDRRATTESRDLGQFNLEGRFCRPAIEQIVKYLEYQHNDMHIRPSYDGDFLADAKQAFLDSGLAKRRSFDGISVDPQVLHVNHFLNRLLGMKVRIQNSLFQLFTDYMDKLIARKKVSGQYDSGILELNSESGKTTCLPPEDFYLKTRAGTIKCTLRHVQVERGIPWDEARKLYEDSCIDKKDGRSGFYSGPGNAQTISLLLREPDSVDLFRILKPNIGRGAKPLYYDMIKKGKKYSLQQAEALWHKIYVSSAQNCIHLCFFDSCKRREAKMPCEMGMRYRKFCILSGGILTAWPYLERSSAEITERVRIVRLKLDANNRVIGPNISQQYVPRVREILSKGAKETVVF